MPNPQSSPFPSGFVIRILHTLIPTPCPSKNSYKVKSTYHKASHHAVLSIFLLLLLSQTHPDILLTNTHDLQTSSKSFHLFRGLSKQHNLGRHLYECVYACACVYFTVRGDSCNVLFQVISTVL
jgi:hypothetical protein